MTRPRLRLERSWSQWRDRDRDWKSRSLNDETETETEKVWVSMTRPRPRLKRFESQSRDRDRDHKNIETKTKVVETIKDETRKFGLRLISENLSRPRLIETGKFHKCRDRDLTRLRPIETGQKMLRPRLYRESCWFLLWETLTMEKKKKRAELCRAKLSYWLASLCSTVLITIARAEK